MKKTNKVLSFFFALLLALIPLPVFSGCSCKNDAGTMELKDCGIIHEQEFGGVYIKKTIEDFNALGFKYGDSVTITFSNGYKLEDIPYYNGYYTQTGEPLLIAYPGYDYIKAAINNGDDLWEAGGLMLQSSPVETHSLWSGANLEGDMKATITLYQAGKYKDIQEARDIHYFDDRTLYPSDEVFANFRSLKGGNLKDNWLYRSASPCDNQHSRASYVDKLCQEVGIQRIINLADTDAKIQTYMARTDFNSQYFATLYNAYDAQNDSVVPLALNMNFGSDYFKGQVIKAMKELANHNVKSLIHCTEGKDRTGFLCMLIEAFAGATYNEIVEDYMMTYFNYYSISKAFDAKRYNIIVENVLDPMIQTMVGQNNVNIKTANLAEYAKNYLISNNMTQEEVNLLRANICKVL